jgi:hypothetical protein
VAKALQKAGENQSARTGCRTRSCTIALRWGPEGFGQVGCGTGGHAIELGLGDCQRLGGPPPENAGTRCRQGVGRGLIWRVWVLGLPVCS